MVGNTCDRCGKGCKRIERDLADVVITRKVRDDTRIYHHKQTRIDLCDECKNEFIKWLDEFKLVN